MVGFEDAVNMAEETTDPQRTFPRAMLWGLVVTAVIYLLVTVLASTLVPATDLGAAGSGALLRVLEVGAPAFAGVWGGARRRTPWVAIVFSGPSRSPRT